MILLGTEVKLTGLWLPGSSFLPFLKMGFVFPLLSLDSALSLLPGVSCQ